MNSLEVLTPGTQVQFINAGRVNAINDHLPIGTIVGIYIRDDFSICYDVVWWDENGRNLDQVNNIEIVPWKTEFKTKIGFKNE